jgi:DNA polymerase-3 subunit epsilon
LRLGYDGAKLGHLVMQAGWYCDGHRAAVDVAALFHLLQSGGSIGGDMPRTHLQRLLERADRPMVRVAAVRPDYAHTPELKARGYRWAPENKSWWIDVSDHDADCEKNWLRFQGIRAIDCTHQTACDRHRPLRRPVIQVDEPDEAPF